MVYLCQQYLPRLSTMRTTVGFFMPSKKPFDKLPTTIEEQISLLKRRGLTIPDEIEAAHFLKFVSYYRLSAYTFYYEKKNLDGVRSHAFYEGKTFKDITDLYIFDSKLRRLFWEAIERIEIAFRTSMTYHLSLRHGAHWYMQKNLFLERFNIDELIDTIKSETGFHLGSDHPKRKMGEVFIHHYYTTYSTPNYLRHG